MTRSVSPKSNLTKVFGGFLVVGIILQVIAWGLIKSTPLEDHHIIEALSWSKTMYYKTLIFALVGGVYGYSGNLYNRVSKSFITAIAYYIGALLSYLLLHFFCPDGLNPKAPIFQLSFAMGVTFGIGSYFAHITDNVSTRG